MQTANLPAYGSAFLKLCYRHRVWVTNSPEPKGNFGIFVKGYVFIKPLFIKSVLIYCIISAKSIFLKFHSSKYCFIFLLCFVFYCLQNISSMINILVYVDFLCSQYCTNKFTDEHLLYKVPI